MKLQETTLEEFIQDRLSDDKNFINRYKDFKQQLLARYPHMTASMLVDVYSNREIVDYIDEWVDANSYMECMEFERLKSMPFNVAKL